MDTNAPDDTEDDIDAARGDADADVPEPKNDVVEEPDDSGDATATESGA